MADFVYPSNAELREIAQNKIARLEQDRPIFKLLPATESEAYLLLWEQMDDYVGLQQIRGLDGAPGRVAKTGMNRYMAQPGVYGEFTVIDETELTMRRLPGTFDKPVDVSDLVLREQDKLLLRRLDRLEYIGWNALLGTYSVSGGPGGGVVHTDTWTVQTYDASSWGTPSTATPLLDFRAVQLKEEGYSVSFGPDAEAFMNRRTFNKLIANTNDADLGGKRKAGLANVLSLADANMVLNAEGLPAMRIYHQGYKADNGTFATFIPDNKVIVVGQRPAGQRIGEYRMVRNVNNEGMAPGAYMKVIDRGQNQVPRTIEVHDGHNGGPVLFFPSAIVIMDVS